MVNPLPTPDITPPNIAHNNKSEPASGETRLTSIGRTSVIKKANSEYIPTVNREYIVKANPSFLYPKIKIGTLKTSKKIDNVK